jgi:tight adherence protein B
MLLIVALVMAVASAAVLGTLWEPLSSWWMGRISRYGYWMSVEFGSMFREMTLDRAQRIITGTMLTGFALGVLLGDGWLGRLFAGLLLGLGGYFGPWAVVAYLRYRRLEELDNQLVDALQMMSNALKAGLSLQQAMELVMREMKPPISDEFSRVVKEIHLGELTDNALRRLPERVPLDDVELTIESILTLRETGGNLSESFQVIAKTVVERKKVQGKIKSLTAQGMAQGVLVSLMPMALLLIFSFIDASYIRPFFTTPIGLSMLLVVIVLEGLGLWMMFKLVQVEV